jgi:tetratricopeptide (TPR) repeat protein
MALQLVYDLIYKAQRELTEPGEQQRIRKILIGIARDGVDRLSAYSDAIAGFAYRGAATMCILDGNSLSQIGEFGAAREQYQKALNMLETLQKDPNANLRALKHDDTAARLSQEIQKYADIYLPELKHDEVVARCGLARLNRRESKYDDGRSEFTRAALLVGELRAGGYSTAALDRDAWVIELGLGEIDLAESHADAALARFQRAEQYLPSGDQVLLKRRTFRDLLMQYVQTGDANKLSQAMNVIERVIAECRSLHARLPKDERIARDLAGSLQEWAMGLRHQQRSADADAARNEATRLLTALDRKAPTTADDPQTP